MNPMKAVPLAALAMAAAFGGGAAQAAVADRPLRVVVLDVEGGGGTLFVTPEGRSVLVDTGWPHRDPPAPVPGQPPPPPPNPASVGVIRAAMDRLDLKRIDYLLITHYHGDHIGGIQEVMAEIPIGTVIDHGPNREDAPGTIAGVARYEAAIKGKPHRVFGPGDVLRVGSLTLNFVVADRKTIDKPLPGGGGQTPFCDTPDKTGSEGGEENPRSLGFVATYGKARLMLLGDLTWNTEKALVCPVNKIGPIDLLVVSHHGSELSSSPPLLAAASPRVALMGNGARKGGDASVFANIRATPSKPVLWQSHSASRSPEVDGPQSRIANLSGAPHIAHELQALVSRDGAIQVVNTRNGYTETYPAP
jgi:beta-lactamase superfamily II metal-dependent hydrolase